ncbi:MAG: heavy metal translocating P-type ATPase, partial [Dehalococcoidia bacterium]
MKHSEHDMHDMHSGHDEAATASAGPAGADHSSHSAPDARHGGHSSHGAHGGGGAHAGHDPEAFRRLFWLSLILTIPTIAFSEMVQEWLGYSLAAVPGHLLVSPVLGTAVFLYGGRVFLQGG